MRKLCLTAAAALAASLLFALFGCESDPCVGEGCPDACNGADCAAPPGDGTLPLGDTRNVPATRFVTWGVGFTASGAVVFTTARLIPTAPESGFAPSSRQESLAKILLAEGRRAPVGGFYTSCPSTTECDTEAGFECVGSGVGDLDAYCTKGCGEDSECPTGFVCDRVSVTPL